MKKIRLIYALILAFTLQFATAQNYVVTSVAKQGATYLQVAENSLTFSQSAGEQTVAVTTNLEFQFESDADWCTVAKDGSNLKYLSQKTTMARTAAPL